MSIRPHLLLLLFAFGCEPEHTWLDGRLEGTLNGKALKLRFHSWADVGGLDSVAINSTSNRDVSQNATSTLPLHTRVTNEQGSAFEKVDGVEMFVSGLPPSPLRAGDYTPGDFTLALWENANEFSGTKIVTWDNDRPRLTYDSVELTGQDKLKVFLRGRIAGTLAGGDVKLDGTFQFVVDCSYTKYYRLCGQSGGGINVAAKPWVENDCPAALLEPYDAPYAFTENSLKARSATLSCSTSKGGQVGVTEGLALCHARQDGVSADGCSWRVEAMADGDAQSFAVSAWANEGCQRPQKFCNAWR